MPRAWKSEISCTLQHRILMLKYGSIQENPLISTLRKSRQNWLVTKLVPRFRRAPGSKELTNGLAPAARSIPRNPASVPPSPLVFTHDTLFGKCFCQIILLSIWNTPRYQFYPHQFYPSLSNSQVPYPRCVGLKNSSICPALRPC